MAFYDNGDNSESSSVDISASEDKIEYLKSAINQFKANVPTCSNYPDIAILTGAGFNTSACEAYDNYVKLFAEKLEKAIESARNYVDAVQSDDAKTEEEIPEEISDDDETEGDSATTAAGDEVSDSSMSEVGVDDGSNKDGESGESTFNPDKRKDTLDNVNNGKVEESYDELVTRCQKNFNKMSRETLESIKKDLILAANNHNVSLEELLTNDKYSQVVLETIVKNSNIDINVANDMKAIGHDIVRKVLSDILINKKESNLNAEELVKKSQDNFNNMSKEALESIKNDLTVVAANSNVSLDELITNDKYSQVVLETVTKNSNVNQDIAHNMEEIGKDIVRESLYNVLTDKDKINNNGTGGGGLSVDEVIKQCDTYYRGMPKETLESVLSGLYTESVKNNISLEQLLTDNKYSQVVLNVIVNNNKVDPNIVANMKTLGQDVSREVLSNILTGNNNILGITKASKENFRVGFSQIVKEKNLNTEELIKGNNNELRTTVSDVKKLFVANNAGDASLKLVDVLLGFNDNKLLSYMVIDLFR